MKREIRVLLFWAALTTVITQVLLYFFEVFNYNSVGEMLLYSVIQFALLLILGRLFRVVRSQPAKVK